jgi:hypothetical protein
MNIAAISCPETTLQHELDTVCRLMPQRPEGIIHTVGIISLQDLCGKQRPKLNMVKCWEQLGFAHIHKELETPKNKACHVLQIGNRCTNQRLKK